MFVSHSEINRFTRVYIGPGTGLLPSFEPRHNLHSDVRTNVRKYVVTWLEHSCESNRPVPGPHLAELSILNEIIRLRFNRGLFYRKK